jgi:predicted Zn-dependent protease
MSPVTIATSIGGSIAGIVAPRVGDFIEGVGTTTTGLVISPHSRTQEREADRLGQEMMARAGYSPAGLTRLLESLQRDEHLETSTGTRTSSFLATHPATGDRVELTGQRAETIPFTARPGIAADRAALFRHLNGLLVGEDPRKGLFVKSQYIDPADDFTMQFPRGWKTAQEPSRVAAQTGKGEAMILLQVLGPSDQKETLIRKSLKKLRVDAMPMQRLSNGLPLWELQKRLSTSAGRLKVHMAWVEYRGRIYEMAGAASEKQFDEYAAPIAKAIYSFRALKPSDLREVQEARLTIAQVYETIALAKLIKQYPDSAWSLEQSAVYNALQSEVLLSAGLPVKLALRKPYRR